MKHVLVIRNKLQKRRYKNIIVPVLILTFALLTSYSFINATFENELPRFASENNRYFLESRGLVEEQLQILEEMQATVPQRGLIGFEGQYSLLEDRTLVSVIVILESNPAGVQVIESLLEDSFLSYASAEQLVEDEHMRFRKELSALFNTYENMRSDPPYRITQQYFRGFVGVAMTLPSDMVVEVARFSSVRAIIPDESVYIEEVEPTSIPALPGDPFGMSQGRARMNIHELHNRGFTGEGVVIAVVDSGIDWQHPAIVGTFPTIEEMQQRNPEITNEHGINIDGIYYFIGRDFIRLWPGGDGDDLRGNPTSLPPGKSGNDPMEFSPHHFPNRTNPYLVDNAGNAVNYTSHGTHVAGTIVGQPVPTEIAPSTGDPIWDLYQTILGVAPGAKVFHYRVLFGATPTSIIMASLEQTYYDQPDVVSMSLSGGLAYPMAIQNIAINNLMLQNPNKTFVVSAGNTGSNFYTVANPSGATAAITVSNLSEEEVLVGANLTSSDNVNTTAFPVMGNPNAQWIVNEIGRMTNTFSRLIDTEGTYRIFALPDFGSAAATGTEDINIGSAFGLGLVQSFVDLFTSFDPLLLEGAFILVRRPFDDNIGLENAPLIAFDPTIVGAPPGIFDLIGGVIIVDGTAQNRTQPRNLFNQVNMVPTLMIDNESGRTLFDHILASDTGYTTFSLSGDLVGQTVAPSSSRGPVMQSFEIKPDVGAHGTHVFSAVPRWTYGGVNANNPNWQEVPWSRAYDFRTGSSMSTPHIAGGVALMIQYSREVGTPWDNQEIKSRIMNTAVNLDYSSNNYGVFDGARQADIWAAVQADTVVSVNFPRVATELGIPFEQQPFETVRTGSFSFGGFNRYVSGDEVISESLTATITNHSNTSRSYTITHEFITTGRNSLSGATLDHPLTVTVEANSTADFIATLHIPPKDMLGHYEGHVIVSYGSEIVARLPFAGVTINNPPTVQNVITYRPVISTSPYAQNTTSRELVISYTANFGFSTNLHLIRAVSGINEHNWDSPAFEHAVLGTIGNSRFFSAAGGRIQPRTPMRGVIFDGTYMPVGSHESINLYEEGDYYIVMEVWRQSPNFTNGWAWENNILIPFSVDNTLPKFNSIVVNDVEVDLASENLAVQIAPTSKNDLVITGNVYDAWLIQAINDGVRFDVWHENMQAYPYVVNPFGPYLSVSNNLALWVLVGENKPDNRPTFVELSPSGDFTVTLANEISEDITEVSLWLIDGYAPVPSVNQVLFGTNPWNGMGTVRVTPDTNGHFEFPGGGVWVEEYLTYFLRNEPIYAWESLQIPSMAFEWYDWSGLNVTEKTLLITDVASECKVLVEGQFVGATGSAWRICDDGTLEIDEGVINWTGALSPWHNHRALITQVEITGPIRAGASLRALFRELTEVEEINGLTYFDTNATTSMYRMFFGLSGVTELDVTNFVTNSVTNMALMFRDASSLVELDVSNFNTTGVTDMREMFRGTSIEVLDLSGFDTGNVMNMNHMFTALHTLRELTLGEAFSFIGTPNLVPIRQTETYTGLWQGEGVALTSAQLMAQFDGNTMTGAFVRQRWTASDPAECAIVARGRFANGIHIGGAQWHLCDNGTLVVGSGFINWTLVTSPWHENRTDITEIVFTGEVTGGASLRSLFHDLHNLEEIHNLAYLDTSQVENMARMFRGASSLTSLDLSTFDTSNVTDMSWMFFGASGLVTLDVTNFATNHVTNMALMFREVSNLTELDVSNFNTTSVTDMREMFRGMSSLTTLDLDNFDTGNVTNMNHMFVGMSALTELILGGLFTPIGSPGIPRLN